MRTALPVDFLRHPFMISKFQIAGNLYVQRSDRQFKGNMIFIGCRKPMCWKLVGRVCLFVFVGRVWCGLVEFCRKPHCAAGPAKVCRKPHCAAGPAKVCRKPHCAEAWLSCQAGPAALQLVTFDFAGNQAGLT